MEKVTIQTPIKSYKTDTGNYGLIIQDALNVYHYFDYDGTYDGWSVDTNPDGSCPLDGLIKPENEN